MRLVPLISILFLTSCGLFDTRNPEEPETGRNTFIPPTTPQDVIFNLTNSIKEKSVDNYLACLAEKDEINGGGFMFEPASEVNARYPGLFELWDKNAESRYINPLFSNLSDEISPGLDFPEIHNENYVDSALYYGKYTLKLHEQIEGFELEYAGNFRFTIIKDNSGLWSIGRWTDLKLDTEVDTNIETWSEIKAKLYN